MGPLSARRVEYSKARRVASARDFRMRREGKGRRWQADAGPSFLLDTRARYASAPLRAAAGGGEEHARWSMADARRRARFAHAASYICDKRQYI